MWESSRARRLNANLQGAEVRAPEALAAMNPRPATILIVEDHVTTRRFLADNLSADGYEPVEADTARDGRRLMASHSPQLAIIDLGLPDRDGLELLRDVRQSDELVSRIDRHLPVIVLSGRAGELDRVRGFERGADDYLVKAVYAVVSWGAGRVSRRRTGKMTWLSNPAGAALSTTSARG